MGLNWSHRKCKEDTLLVVKTPLTEENNKDWWLLWGNIKGNPDAKNEFKKDGFQLAKEVYKGHQWHIVWFHKIKEDSFDLVEVDGKDIEKWRNDLDSLVEKWVRRLGAIKEAIASNSEDDASVEDPYA